MLLTKFLFLMSSYQICRSCAVNNRQPPKHHSDHAVFLNPLFNVPLDDILVRDFWLTVETNPHRTCKKDCFFWVVLLVKKMLQKKRVGCVLGAPKRAKSRSLSEKNFDFLMTSLEMSRFLWVSRWRCEIRELEKYILCDQFFSMVPNTSVTFTLVQKIFF